MQLAKGKRKPRIRKKKFDPKLVLEDILAKIFVFPFPEIVHEYKFHSTRNWRFDYACPTAKIAIEYEGGLWTGGRHFRPAGALEDLAKYNEAAIAGWKVIRIVGDFLKPTRNSTRRHYSAEDFIKRALGL